MPLQDIRDRVSRLLADIDAELVAQGPRDVVIVDQQDSLPGRIAASDGTATFRLSPGYRLSADLLEIPKPCRIVGDVPELSQATAARPTSTTPMPTLSVGGVKLLAPDVTLQALRIEGRRHDGAMVDAADRMHLSQCYLDGIAGAGVRRGVVVNAADVTIDRSVVVNCFHSEDAQAIVGWDGTKFLTVTDCQLEASGENVMFGGGDPSSAARSPQDIFIQGCTLLKRPEWRGMAGVTVKNIFELKNAMRVQLEGCTLDGCWGGQGQSGYGITLTVRNQDGTAPYSTIADVQVHGCTVRNVASGVQILGRDDSRTSVVMANVVLQDNLFDVDPWGQNGAGHQVFIAAGPQNLQLLGNRFTGAHLNSFLYFDGPQYKCTGLRVERNDAQEGEYGIFGTDAPWLGVRALEMYAPSYVWGSNTLHRGESGRVIGYPAGTQVVA